MSGPFPIKRGDTATPIIGRLRDGNKKLVPLPPGTPVFFAMRPAVLGLPGATFKKPGYIVESPGRVGYSLDPEDVAVAGPYFAEWSVILPGGPQTFPSDGYLDIVIVPDIL